MNEIGGFFELELSKTHEYHGDSIKLNTGRACLRYILKAKKPKKVYLPYYSCNSILDVIIEEKINYEFYNIDKHFNPQFNNQFSKKDFIIYINYFGMKSKMAIELCNKFPNIILDNSQAFFEKPVTNIDVFYSPRKYFGVPDGGFLYTDCKLDNKFKKDISYKRVKHLMCRLDLEATSAYPFYLQNEDFLNSQPIKKMSKLTDSILSSIDYHEVRLIRNNNYRFLHNHLEKHNQLKINIDINYLNGPMVYPFLFKKDGFRQFLISNKIYVATYWKEVLSRTAEDTIENYFTKYLIPLPIDQRYGNSDMNYIVKKVKEYLI